MLRPRSRRVRLLATLTLVSLMPGPLPAAEPPGRLAQEAYRRAAEAQDPEAMHQVELLDATGFFPRLAGQPAPDSPEAWRRAAAGAADPRVEEAVEQFLVRAPQAGSGRRGPAGMAEPRRDWNERIAPDEAERFAGYAGEIRALQDHFAAKQGIEVRRGFHSKAHAGLRAELEVLPGLPDWAYQGAFTAGAKYPAWIRFSNGMNTVEKDGRPDVRGMAVKLTGVPGPSLEADPLGGSTLDLLAINAPVMPARSAEQFMVITRATRNLFTLPWKILRGFGLCDSLRSARVVLAGLSKTVRSLALEDYWSNVPVSWGPYAAKFKWVPRQTERLSERFTGGDRLRRELEARLAGGPVGFDLQVQFWHDEERTPIEDASVAWPPGLSPYLTVARLTVAAGTPNQEPVVNGMSFTPWHAPAGHRPLGDVQRARRVVYRASAVHRGVGR